MQVKEQLLELRYGASLKAEKYDAWSANAAAAAASLTPKQRDVTSNAYHQLPPDFRTVVLTADGKSADGKCFDVPYYKHVSGFLVSVLLCRVDFHRLRIPHGDADRRRQVGGR